jgi:hypothetical protein
LAERKHPQALALPCSVQQGVELRAECLAHWRCNRCEFTGELDERVTEAGAEAHARKEGPQTLGGAVEAIGEHPFDLVRWLLVERRALKRPI